MCCVILSGFCTICINKCNWSYHKKEGYVLKCSLQKVKKTYNEGKRRYERAMGFKLTHEKYIKELTYHVDDIFRNVKQMMEEMKECGIKLKKNSIKT